MKYRVLRERQIRGATYAKAGDIVYPLAGYDYGCASEDSRHLNIEHRSVTHNPKGDYPFFTIPVADLEAVEQSA